MIAFQWKTDHQQTDYTDTLFCSCDLGLGLDPMTLMYEPDLDMLKMYVQSQVKAFKS